MEQLEQELDRARKDKADLVADVARAKAAASAMEQQVSLLHAVLPKLLTASTLHMM